MSLRECCVCGDEFEPSRTKGQTRTYNQCYRCSYLKSAFGITNHDYKVMLAAQDGTCAICDRSCKTGRRLSVDHDHACCPGRKSCGDCVRGLLCYTCNAYLIGVYEKLPADMQDWPRLNSYLGI